MRHHYSNKFDAIQCELDELKQEFDLDQMHFWLHIDGDKLQKCVDLLQSMTTAIAIEKEQTS